MSENFVAMLDNEINRERQRARENVIRWWRQATGGAEPNEQQISQAMEMIYGDK